MMAAKHAAVTIDEGGHVLVESGQDRLSGLDTACRRLPPPGYGAKMYVEQGVDSERRCVA